MGSRWGTTTKRISGWTSEKNLSYGGLMADEGEVGFSTGTTDWGHTDRETFDTPSLVLASHW